MHTRLMRNYHLSLPIVSAPMAAIAGGNLAASVINAGGFGLVGAGYGDRSFLEREYELALSSLKDFGDRDKLGVGFISWKLYENPHALTYILEHAYKPKAIFLSFGDPASFAEKILEAGCELWCQTHNLEQVKHSLDVGAKVIIAQGGGGGGHSVIASNARSTITFVPEAVDWVCEHSPKALVLAAGGIVDARTILASLSLGADGVLLGTALWLATESLASQAAKTYALTADGDATMQSTVLDILREFPWPQGYDIRTLKSTFLEKWSDDIPGLLNNLPQIRQQYLDSIAQGNPENSVIVGQSIGLLHQVESTQQIFERLSTELDVQARKLQEITGLATDI